MSESTGLGIGVARARSCRCPGCNQMINTGTRQCPFCATLIDSTAAQAAAELQGRVAQASSDASQVKLTAQAMLGLLALQLVPILSLVGLVVNCILFVVVPVLAVRWWARHGRVRSADPDYKQARRGVLTALTIWLLINPAYFVVDFVVGLIGAVLPFPLNLVAVVILGYLMWRWARDKSVIG